ncbi:MAG: RNB domain-containing ribonuclease [Micromonosporaceae bacterium]
MVTRLVRASRIDFTSLRRELELPTQFPLAAQHEADAAATQRPAEPPGERRPDRTDLRLVTVDPAGSRDLDQAIGLERLGRGYRVCYAIADVAAFVTPGGPLDAETWRRGETVYLPDGRTPLHPPSLSEGAASLLPGQPRPAVLWTIDLDADGATRAVRVERAIVRSGAQLDYVGAQAATTAGRLDEPIELLPEVGRLLVAHGLARGAVNLPIPEQEVEPDDGGWRLVLRARLPVEEWNAQVSLLTGMAAAQIMLDGRVGVLRTMPAPDPTALDRLRVAAAALGIAWPDATSVGQVVAAVDPASARGAAFVEHAAELMRGAGYTAFDGSAPAAATHGAVAAAYAHVTAPLRRLADRYATEVCLSLVGGRSLPEWVRTALPRLPETMAASNRRANAAERGAVDLAEATLLSGRIGEEFDAAVLDVDEHPRPDRAAAGVVALDDPPVRGRCEGALPLGERVRVRLVRADPVHRQVLFEKA